MITPAEVGGFDRKAFGFAELNFCMFWTKSCPRTVTSDPPVFADMAAAEVDFSVLTLSEEFLASPATCIMI